MANRAMGPVDTIWLNMDRPDNLMVIDSVIFFDGAVDWSRAAALIQRRIVDLYPSFRQRVVQPRAHVGSPHWEDDPGFDLDNHLIRATLARGDDEALQQYIEGRMHVSLDRSRPLWEMHFIDGYRQGAVLYSRLHHCIADGIALNDVMLSMTGDSPDSDLADTPPAESEHHAGVLESAARLAGTAVSGTLGAASGAAHMLLDLPKLFDPHVLGDAFTQAERTGEIANKLVLGRKPHTPVSGEPGLAKRAVWCEPFPLADMKHIGHRTGTTVNDVLMGAVAGALATYIRDHGGEPSDVPTMVPVNVRPLDQPLPKELGNQFALVLFKYPSALATPLERIVETHRRMEVIKHSPEVALTFGLIKAIGRTGPELERFFVDFFADKAIGVTTNVPGPATTRYMAGTKIRSVLGWVPGSGEQTLGISIYSYNGQVRVGFKSDATRVPDPEALVRAFTEEIDGLLRLSQAV